jgi:hypothetical protein
MKAAEALKHRLKLLAGLPPKSPTDKELELIIQRILPIRRQRVPTEADWKAAAMAVVPGAGTYKYAGEDLSDLNELLLAILGEDSE